MLHSPEANDHLAHRPGLVCTRRTNASTLLRRSLHRPRERRCGFPGGHDRGWWRRAHDPHADLAVRNHTFDAISSDLVAAVVMRPIGAAVHLGKGTVNLALVGWMVLGSVPMARAPDRYIRPVITFVILASGLKYVGVGTMALGWVLCATLLGAGAIWLAYVRPWRNADSESGQSRDTIIETVPEVPGSDSHVLPVGRSAPVFDRARLK